MQSMERRGDLPDTNRLSVLSATVLLSYALTRFVSIPAWQASFGLVGVKIALQVDFKTVVSVMVALLAAVGSDWLLRDHPALAQGDQGWSKNVQHWILPALTAWVIGVPLNTLSGGAGWWVVFGMGSVLLVLVFVAEYSVANPSDLSHPAAVVGLTALSFTLYLLLAIAIRSSGLRLYLMLPALVAAGGLVCLRTLYLRSKGQWLLVWSGVTAVVVGQMAIGLHYLPLSPVGFGLLLLGPTYSLTSLAALRSDGRSWRDALGEPVIMLVLVWGLALWLR
jgi:hypothetical protein